ncbi:7-cyano-7-deazaguanine reductase [Streptococcus pneumoniae]|nr:7-cyano-7-deazaguanine reductase [Streptococcus pneumoniae]VLU75123.1 7-cyano-7-deazaguanine reductase [Streptococcus pneumoniae]VMA66489.1 7-cyano-7-deazaguanine reductase [Streptococcus pneumoniae]VMC77966.1 7-cyano-7-deazaguanine reductase [Streptococcus pneumoniae]VMN49386.1 7-cyano-7-deazaguanine reductase [Streptococcus pneumoniae]
MKRQSALVVFSGGQDSTTCLLWTMQHYETVEAVTFAYGQRHHLEIQIAREIAKEQGIRHHILDMSLLDKSLLNQTLRRFIFPTFLTSSVSSQNPSNYIYLATEITEISTKTVSTPSGKTWSTC